MIGEPLTAVGVAAAVGWTLLHSLWQAAILWLAIAAFRRRVTDPRLRSRAADAGLVLMLLAQAATLIACLSRIADLPLPWREAPPIELTKIGTIRRPPLLVGGWAGDAVAQLDPLMPWLVGLWWACGVARLTLYARAAWLASRALSLAPPLPEGTLAACRRIATELGVTRPVRFVAAALTEGPGTIGWLRPYVFVPPAVLLSMPPAQLEAILTHELAHVLRRDYLSATLRLAVASLYAANPFVGRVVTWAANDAEESCDAIATARTGRPAEYARALSTLADVVVMQRATLNATGDGSLKARVATILRPPPPTGARTIWGRAIGASVAAALLLTLASGAIAEASTRQRELRWLESRSLGEAVREIVNESSPTNGTAAGATRLAEIRRWSADERSADATLSLTRALVDPETYVTAGISSNDRRRLMRAAAFDDDRTDGLVREGRVAADYVPDEFARFEYALARSPVSQHLLVLELDGPARTRLRERIRVAAAAENRDRFRELTSASDGARSKDPVDPTTTSTRRLIIAGLRRSSTRPHVTQ